MPDGLIPIEDPADERLAPYRSLRDAELHRRSGRFVAEGHLAAAALAASSWPIESLLVEEGKRAAHDDLVGAARSRGAAVYVASRAVIASTTGFDLHRGVVAAGVRVDPPEAERVLARAAGRAVLVIEGVNDHENLGALFRNAAALGAAAVMLDPSTADPLYRRSIRVSLGHVLRIPWSRFGEDWPTGLGRLAALGWRVVALTPRGGELLSGLRRDGPVALVVGAEGAGLSAGALAAADCRVRIAMTAGVDSLNVATAAAIALHHLGSPG